MGYGISGFSRNGIWHKRFLSQWDILAMGYGISGWEMNRRGRISIGILLGEMERWNIIVLLRLHFARPLTPYPITQHDAGATVLRCAHIHHSAEDCMTSGIIFRKIKWHCSSSAVDHKHPSFSLIIFIPNGRVYTNLCTRTHAYSHTYMHIHTHTRVQIIRSLDHCTSFRWIDYYAGQHCI
jgi:hypothetical protein